MFSNAPGQLGQINFICTNDFCWRIQNPQLPKRYEESHYSAPRTDGKFYLYFHEQAKIFPTVDATCQIPAVIDLTELEHDEIKTIVKEYVENRCGDDNSVNDSDNGDNKLGEHI